MSDKGYRAIPTERVWRSYPESYVESLEAEVERLRLCLKQEQDLSNDMHLEVERLERDRDAWKARAEDTRNSVLKAEVERLRAMLPPDDVDDWSLLKERAETAEAEVERLRAARAPAHLSRDEMWAEVERLREALDPTNDASAKLVSDVIEASRVYAVSATPRGLMVRADDLARDILTALREEFT